MTIAIKQEVVYALRLSYLHLIFVQSEGQGRDHAYLYCE